MFAAPRTKGESDSVVYARGSPRLRMTDSPSHDFSGILKPLFRDCSIREGAYLSGGRFEFEAVATHIDRAVMAGVRHVEIGPPAGIGGISRDPISLSFLRECGGLIPRSGQLQASVFAIAAETSVADLSSIESSKIYRIRIGLTPECSNLSPGVVKFINEFDGTVSICFMRAQEFPTDVILKVIESLGDFVTISEFSVFDSAGGMLPSTVQRIFGKIAGASDKALGFHGHNNLGLAVQNAVTAFESGATFLDCTCRGVGRSAGNAPLELVAGCFSKLGLLTRTEVENLVRFAEHFPELEAEMSMKAPKNALLGLDDVHSGVEVLGTLE